MLSTTILIAVLLGQITVSIFLWAAFLRLGLRWAKADHVTIGKIGAATAIVIAIQVAINVLFRFISPSTPGQANFFLLLQLAAGVLVPSAVIARVFKTSFARSLQAWLPTLIPSAAMVMLTFLTVRPFLFEEFSIQSNAMAPTLIGYRSQGVCPKCNEPNYGSLDRRKYGQPLKRHMICRNFHVVRASQIGQQVLAADRFMVSKYLTPRRWDVVMFQRPGNPSILYAMRLVGLPGESIHIHNGAVWANGKKLTPPASLNGIEYLSRRPFSFAESWGTVDKPAVLGKEEYFVLGDFSARSHDSRSWQQGAPGHHPYAVPESHIQGVVTHIYWPPGRWRILR